VTRYIYQGLGAPGFQSTPHPCNRREFPGGRCSGAETTPPVGPFFTHREARSSSDTPIVTRFQSWYRIQPTALRALLTINVVLYVLWQVIFIHVGPVGAFVVNHLALNPSLPGIFFEPWQFFTYSFLHLRPGIWGLIHIGFNMLWLFWIGKEYEEMHGPHRLLAAYLIGSFGGGLVTVLLHALLPGVGAFGGIVHGASAAVLGVITAVAILFPYKSIALLFIGTVRLIYVVIGFLALDILFLAGSNTSVSAHLGGALFGFLLARAEGSGMDLSSWARIFFQRSGRRSSRGSAESSARPSMWLGRPTEKTERPRPATIHTLRTSREPDEPPSGDMEVDRILDKISEQGYEALSAEEKRILYEASKK
jgi:membrane associated rhomboid family serine protease